MEQNDDFLLFCRERSSFVSIRQKNPVCPFEVRRNNQNPIQGGGIFRMGRKKWEGGTQSYVCWFSPPHCDFGTHFGFFSGFCENTTMNGWCGGSSGSGVEDSVVD